jgi:hypothetical protein
MLTMHVIIGDTQRCCCPKYKDINNNHNKERVKVLS